MVTNHWSGIISAHIFRKSRAVLLLGGVMITCCPCYTPFLKVQLNKQNYNYAATCNISLGLHRKILIHNWVWRWTWVKVVPYCMNAAQNKREGYVTVT